MNPHEEALLTPTMTRVNAGHADRVLVVVPALNEAQSVASVVSEIRLCVPIADVLVVDDGSVDGTADIARRAGAEVCRLPFNLGVGGAMRTGYRYALRNGYDAVVQVDADGQHDPTYIPVMVAALASSDIVIGSRFAGEGDYAVGGPRRWAMRVLSSVVGGLAGVPLSDVTSGYRAANRRAIQIFARHYPSEYLGDTVESLVIALRTGCTLQQVPVSMRPRCTGRASQNAFRSALYLARATAALGLALFRRWPSVLEPRELT